MERPSRNDLTATRLLIFPHVAGMPAIWIGRSVSCSSLSPFSHMQHVNEQCRFDSVQRGSQLIYIDWLGCTFLGCEGFTAASSSLLNFTIIKPQMGSDCIFFSTEQRSM